MATYRPGVNGSSRGTSGGVTTYTYKGSWVSRAKRKPSLSFVPTPLQQVVITNFTTLSKALKAYAPAFRWGFSQFVAGMTPRALGNKINYAEQMRGRKGGVITFDPSRVIVSEGNFGAWDCEVTISPSLEVSLRWTAPTPADPLYGGWVVALVANETTQRGSTFVTYTNKETANFDLRELGRLPDEGALFVFARTLQGSTRALRFPITWGA